MASIARRGVPLAVALLVPALLQGQHARTISVDKARKLLGGDFYVVPDLPILKIEDVSYQCSTTCTTAVRVQQQVKPNEWIYLIETMVKPGLTTTEAILSPARFRFSGSDPFTPRRMLLTRETEALVLRIYGYLSVGRLASMLNAAVPLGTK